MTIKLEYLNDHTNQKSCLILANQNKFKKLYFCAE